MEVLYFFVTEKYIKVFDVYDENTEITNNGFKSH